MKIAIVLCLSLSFSLYSDQYIKAGKTVSQLIVKGNQAVTISSGYKNNGYSFPSTVESIDLENFEVLYQTKFPIKQHAYSGVIYKDQLLVGDWAEKVVFQLGNPFEASTKITPLINEGIEENFIGMESMQVIGDHLWVSFANPASTADWSQYQDGVILVFDLKSETPKLVQKIITQLPNPKTLKYLDNKLIISMGDYQNPGGVAVLDPKEIPLDGEAIDLRIRKDLVLNYFKVEGAPGALEYDKQNNDVYFCDLSYKPGKSGKNGSFYKANLDTGRITRYRGSFNSCSGIQVSENNIYLLNLNGGGEASSPYHLYVYNKTSFDSVCLKTLDPGENGNILEFFPSNLTLYSGEKGRDFLLLTIGGRDFGEVGIYPGLVGKIPLNQDGIPKTDC